MGHQIGVVGRRAGSFDEASREGPQGVGADQEVGISISVHVKRLPHDGSHMGT